MSGRRGSPGRLTMADHAVIRRFQGQELRDDLSDLGVLEAAAHLRARRFSARELLEACEARIAQVNGGEPALYGAPDQINAWIRLYPEVARQHAAAADERLAREGDEAPLLCGIPLGLKDVFAVDGLPVTASSKLLEGNIATSDSVLWARLRDAGMVLMGHTHTHEFAFGGTCDQVGNPWDLSLTAGGSSGGSAAALIARMVPATTGTDTIGSVRIPAAVCGVAGIKPTRARLPTAGIVPCAYSMDTPGPLARSVADCAALLAAMAAGGGDVLAQATPAQPLVELPLIPRTGAQPLAGVTVALTDRFSSSVLDEDTLAGYEVARQAIQRLGATVVERHAPTRRASVGEFVTIVSAEAWTYHRQFAGREDGYRPTIRAAIEHATPGPSAADYVAVQQARDARASCWEAWMADNDIDLVLEPTAPVVAYERGDGYEYTTHNPFAELALEWSMTGHPVVALPAGLGGRSGLPVGISLIARRGREDLAVQVGIDLQEQALPPLGMPSAAGPSESGHDKARPDRLRRATPKEVR